MSKTPVWPVAIIATFVLFIAGIVTFVVWTSSHQVDLVASDYYEQEIAYQQRIDAEARAQVPGRELSFEHDEAGQEVALTFAATVENGTVTLYRPSDASLDQVQEIDLDGKGTQRISTAGLAAGLWRVKVEWDVEGELHFFEEVVVLP